ncbi:MAG: 2,3-bisphosphoglycerate-independent phosphoglycerate mutase [Alphaproteobacteria bacterium]
MKKAQCPKPIVLCVLDGWGCAHKSPFNAITLANTPTWDKWNAQQPPCLLDAAGESVGLPAGQMGNSEVGHMTIGTGRVIFQDLPRISKSIADGNLFKKPLLLKLVETLKKKKGACHLMGLVSPGGVHSHQKHLFALVEFLSSHGIPLKIHAFLDGRDTPPQSSIQYLNELLNLLKKCPQAEISTIMGRYYAMDRDNRWDRTQKAAEALVFAKGDALPCPLNSQTPDAKIAEILNRCYAQNLTDEFIPPLVSPSYKGAQEGDAIFMTNFRSDRVRQILRSLVDPNFSDFQWKHKPAWSMKMAMTSYAKDLDSQMDVLFPNVSPHHTLGEILSDAHLTQLRIAETEKYAHVTFFFNGGKETPFPHEDRILVPSPKVSTYDLSPAMSAFELTDKVLHAIESGAYDVIIMNYANTDMVGHTGKLEPTIKAVEVVDTCLGKLEQAVLKAGGVLLVTADHGNAEMMEDTKTHQPHTAHTTNHVPFIAVGVPHSIRSSGTLADVAPTVLKLLNLPVPKEMTGESLIK